MSDPDEGLRWEEVEAWLAAARRDRDAAIACLAATPRRNARRASGESRMISSPLARHCEQSEAIHSDSAAEWIASSLRSSQ